MEYQDLRDWIQIADEMGELKTLKGCDWNLEIGAITEIGRPQRRWTRRFIRRYQGLSKGYRVLSNSLVIAETAGADPRSSGRRNQNGFRQDLERQLQEYQTDPGQIRQEKRAIR